MTKDRMVTLAGAVLALALVYLLFFAPGDTDRKVFSRPLSTDGRNDGYLGLVRWLEVHGIRVISLRDRFHWLTAEDRDTAPAGNLLVSTVPPLYPVRHQESDELKRWIARGNTLLIVAALSDTPQWSERYHYWQIYNAIDQMTGLQLLYAETDEGEGDEAPEEQNTEQDSPSQWMNTTTGPFTEPEPLRLEPVGPHPLFRRVSHLEIEPEVYRAAWRLQHPDEGVVLSLMKDAEIGDTALWQARYGQGQVLVSAYAGVLSNRQVSVADNARWFGNLAEYALGPGGSVIFDDMHQGLSVLYDPEAFYADPRLHHTVLFIIGFWFLYVMGSTNRLSPAQIEVARPRREKDFICATGGFFARALGARRGASALLKHFFNDVRLRFGMPPNGEPAWEKLEASPRVPPEWLDALRRMHESLSGGRDVDIRKLYVLTRRIKERLL